MSRWFYEEDEFVAWYYWEKVKDDYRLMPNLRIIIPLLEMESSGWRITYQQFSVDVEFIKKSSMGD